MPRQRSARARERNPKGVYVMLGALALALGALVVWSLTQPASDLGPGVTVTGDGAPSDDASGDAASATSRGHSASAGALEVLPEAACELAVLTKVPASELAKIDGEAATKLLDARTCGAGCDAVKAALVDKTRFELEVSTADDYILPPQEAFEAMAPALSVDERESLDKRPSVLVVRAHAPTNLDQLTARLCFTAAAALGQKVDGLIYDEVARRFERPSQVADHAVTVPLGKPVFLPRMISVQLYRQDDGTARLVTLGMARFGSPDFVVRGASMDAGPALANVINVVAWHAAAMERALPLTVTMADLSRATGLTADKLSKDPAASKPLRLDVVDNERREGDPDNEIVELVPPGGATAEGWSDAIATLYGEPAQIVRVTDDAALDEAGKRARASLPSAIKRWKDGDGALYVKGPFPIPGREDAGAAGMEWMWLDVTSCDAKACAGTLSNNPGYATNLAAGKPVSVERGKAGDWLLQLRDGGTAGGESIRILSR
jgi:uncharacterized protein YegJ (DUF2314 family)